MAYEQKDNSGSLFRNDKRKSDNHPDYTGTALIDGVAMFIAAWIKRPKSPGKQTFMSLSFKRKDKQPGRTEAYEARPEPPQTGEPCGDENEIPF